MPNVNPMIPIRLKHLSRPRRGYSLTMRHAILKCTLVSNCAIEVYDLALTMFFTLYVVALVSQLRLIMVDTVAVLFAVCELS